MLQATRSHTSPAGRVVALMALAIAAVGFTAVPAGAATRMCGGKPVTILGTAGDDEIHGTAGDDVIASRGGHDTVHGAGGNDTICGGRNRDTLYGGDGNDLLSGSYGRDSLWGQAGNDRLGGGAKDDYVYGGDGDDVLRPSGVHRRGNHLEGGRGNDTLYGGPSLDDLLGQEGNDTIYGGPRYDGIDGGPGDDVVHDEKGYASWITTGQGNDTIHASNHCGLPTSNCYDGFGGSLTLAECSDTEAGATTLDMSMGTYTAPTGQGTFTGFFDVIRGSRCDDTILGRADVDEDIEGKGGSDQIEGRGGRDSIMVEDDATRSLSVTVVMGVGQDSLLVRRDSFSPFHLDIQGDGDDGFALAVPHNAKVDLTAGTIAGKSLTGTVAGIANVSLGGPLYDHSNSLAFTLIGDALPNGLFINGESLGTATIDGRGGDDIITSDQGPDLLRGGGGNDTIDGGPNADEIWGEAGIDTVDGGPERIYDDPPNAPYRGPDICAGEHLTNCEDIRTDTNAGAI